MPLHVKKQIIRNEAILFCKGHLATDQESKKLYEEVRQALLDNSEIILDLAQIEYVNSRGLGTLVGLYVTARSLRGHIRYINLSTPVDYSRNLRRAA